MFNYGQIMRLEYKIKDAEYYRDQAQQNYEIAHIEAMRYRDLIVRAETLLDTQRILSDDTVNFKIFLDRIEQQQKEKAELEALTQKVEKILIDRGLLKAKKV